VKDFERDQELVKLRKAAERIADQLWSIDMTLHFVALVAFLIFLYQHHYFFWQK